MICFTTQWDLANVLKAFSSLWSRIFVLVFCSPHVVRVGIKRLFRNMFCVTFASMWMCRETQNRRLASTSLHHRYTVVCVLQRQVWSACAGSGDYVELLGGNGVDTSKMFPVADLCFSLAGLGECAKCANCILQPDFPYKVKRRYISTSFVKPARQYSCQLLHAIPAIVYDQEYFIDLDITFSHIFNF